MNPCQIITVALDRGRSGGSHGGRQKTLSTEEAASLTGNSLVLPVQPNERRRREGALARTAHRNNTSRRQASSDAPSSQGWRYEQVNVAVFI